MKNLILTSVFALVGMLSFAQNYSDIEQPELDSKESYKEAEPQVLLLTNYLFNNPADHEEVNRLRAVQYIMKWMTGTPDYTFELGDNAMSLSKGNSDLLGLYMAAMSKVVIENTDGALTSDEIYNRSEQLLVDYCANSDNNMKPSRKIKKLMKKSKK
ncbi:hypothetical protein LX97_02961 [Nonlabens dokdonensis]|jgi:hypothetical protein|uniref:Uncharacterized protein n=2 Tax=Nonlabens dokdonensis TaxID=328515 RepID=L7W948_NONDD|nr:hypothetical protein [Nonlabens dokdonensis]AGC78245.1 hypothetical protein DDD_3118 [Nonlabens dokdonensis DSW-6]PZX37866.1 hypothetical protein LX97_02961 [Nonlabens dokdonensis]